MALTRRLLSVAQTNTFALTALPCTSRPLSSRRWQKIEMSDNASRCINRIRQSTDGDVRTNATKSVIDLFLGDPAIAGALPPNPRLAAAVSRALEVDSHGYVEAYGMRSGRQAVVDRFSSPDAPFTADDVLLVSGVSHGLLMALEAFADAGENVLLPAPGFPLYTTFAQHLDIERKYYRIKLGREHPVDVEHLESLIDAKTKLIVVNNPGNPTGTTIPKRQLERILEVAEHYRVPILADEIYGNLAYGGSTFHPIATLEPKVPLVTIDGVAKRWFVPGWRLGWMIVHNRDGALDDIRQALLQLSQKIMGPSTVLQEALPEILAYDDTEDIERAKKLVAANYEAYRAALEGVPGIAIMRPTGAIYMMVKVDERYYGPCQAFARKLGEEESVLVLPGSIFELPGYVRLVLVQTVPQAAEAAKRIRAFCERHRKE